MGCVELIIRRYWVNMKVNVHLKSLNIWSKLSAAFKIKIGNYLKQNILKIK
jgi:hypothetical protein